MMAAIAMKMRIGRYSRRSRSIVRRRFGHSRGQNEPDLTREQGGFRARFGAGKQDSSRVFASDSQVVMEREIDAADGQLGSRRAGLANTSPGFALRATPRHFSRLHRGKWRERRGSNPR